VAGAAQFKLVQENSALDVPLAFVVPLDDAPQESLAMNSVRQTMRDSFSVIVAVSNKPDERGQTATHDIDAMRAMLWSALLGWRPASRYDGITYEGGSVLAMDRARLWYQFEFGALMEIEPDDGYQQIELVGLPEFEGMNVNVDAIDPMADPNLQYPGPDGRIEQVFTVPQSGTLSTDLQT
jgi:hypothetical protein